MNHAASSTQLTVGKQGGAFNFWLVTSQLFLPWFPDGQHSKWHAFLFSSLVSGYLHLLACLVIFKSMMDIVYEKEC